DHRAPGRRRFARDGLVAIILVLPFLLVPALACAAPALRVYGAAGTFGGLTGATASPTGQSLAAQPIAGWGFLPGQSAYFPAIGAGGTVLIANEPQTDNQLLPTARQMVVSTFDPATQRFRNVVVPTSTGRTDLGGPWPNASSTVGGGDVSDLEPVQIDGQPRIAFTSAMPFWGWNAASGGEYPTVGFLSRSSTGVWAPDTKHVLTASTIAARSGSTGACTTKNAPSTGTFGDCHMPAELAQLPASGDLVMTQYAFDDAARPSGRISVLDTRGRVQASYAYPAITLPNGTTLAVHPREVDADPLGSTGDERFVVVFDAETGGGALGDPPTAGAIQEFRFDASARRIVPTSAPVLSGDRDRSSGQALGFETAQYGSDGSLWVAQSRTGTLQAGPLAIYHRVAGSASVLGDRPACAASPSWRGQAWGRACAPDERIDAATPLGIGRSLNEDAGTGAMVLTTMSGYVLPVAPAGSAGATTAHVAATPVNLGLDQLADRSTVAIGPRKAAEDPASRTLWVPIQQLATTRTCAAWPCTPRALDQWLYGVDLAQVLGPVTRSASASRAKLDVRRRGRTWSVRAQGGTASRATVRVVWQRHRGGTWTTALSSGTQASALPRRRWRLAAGGWRVRLEPVGGGFSASAWTHVHAG
ncbi:MAG: hypothetical protein REI11_22325, partial [Patulibacter sp.]|nr:hypothetical protein [Patulibacter sp.]